MKRTEIFWTATAVKQRNQVLDYWNERNKSKTYSKKLVIKIHDSLKLLKTNPQLGKKTDFMNNRIMSLGHYSILYREMSLKIVITGFWDNRQDPAKLLMFLKNNS
jgi:plasmid stabilization system protein ParE